MSRAGGQTDLVVLVPDLDIAGTMKSLLNRAESMETRAVSFRVSRHLRRDSGCRVAAAEHLREFIRDHRYAIVVFDKYGCGDPGESRESIRDDVERGLSRNGWENRCKAIVIEPELEAWIWNGSHHVPQILGWKGDYADLRNWLAGAGLWSSDKAKPSAPKQALKAVLRRTRTPLSARLYRSLAETVAVQRCLDPAFNDLKATLQHWFPRSDG